MQKTCSLLFASFLFVSCGGAKTDAPKPNPPNPTPNTPTNNPTPNANGGFDPYAAGYCEISIDGAAPKKVGSSPSTKHWGDEVPWMAKFFCDGFDVIGYGDGSSLPMKPGKYPFFQPGGAKEGVFGIFGFEPYNVTGEVNIETWDENTLKGSFEAKGSYGTKGASGYKESITIKGSFENKKQSSPHRPFMGGTCELVVNDGLIRYEPGSMYAVSSAYWAGPNTKPPKWPLQLNCGKYNFGSSGETKDIPMKAGKYTVSNKNTAGSFSLISPLANPEGELIIESWDMMGIRGSFSVTGPVMFAEDKTPITVQGNFDFKCPYTKPGEPCLDKPTQ